MGQNPIGFHHCPVAMVVANRILSHSGPILSHRYDNIVGQTANYIQVATLSFTEIEVLEISTNTELNVLLNILPIYIFSRTSVPFFSVSPK